MSKVKQVELARLPKDKKTVVTDSKKPSKLKEFKEEVKVVWTNATELTEATSILVVSAYAIYSALKVVERDYRHYILLFAGIVIALRAFVLLRRFLARR